MHPNIVPGALALTTINDVIYKSVEFDSLCGVETPCDDKFFTNTICFVVSVLGDVSMYKRTFVVSSDLIGWILLKNSEIIHDSIERFA